MSIHFSWLTRPSPVELGLAVVIEHGADTVGTVELNQKLELFAQDVSVSINRVILT